jgi:hypothetical protein
MRLVIVGEQFSWRVWSCCWLALLGCLADHALAVTCTNGLGLRLGLGLKKMRWRRCGTCCSGVVCVQNYHFSYSVLYCIPKRTNKQNRRPHPSSFSPSHVSFPTVYEQPYYLARSSQYTTQPNTVLILDLPLPLHILVGDLHPRILLLHSPQTKRGRSLPVPENAKRTPSHGFLACFPLLTNGLGHALHVHPPVDLKLSNFEPSPDDLRMGR